MERLIEKVTQQIDALLRAKDFVVVAIDGKCTSGKTTLAARLAEIYDCNVFHMDDFFLRPDREHRKDLPRSAVMRRIIFVSR